MHVPSKTVSMMAQMTESPLRDFEALIRSGAPIVVVESNEEPQVERMARQIARKLQLKPFRWTATEGLQAFDPMDQPNEPVQKSIDVLNYVKTSAHSSLFVLLDFHPFLDDNIHVRRLKDIALSYEKHYSTVVLVGYVVRVPEELRPFASYFKLPLPSPGELRQIVHEVAAEWGAANGNRDVQTTNKTLDLLVRNLGGLTATDARRLALKAINDNGVISDTDLPEVMRAKYELLSRDSVLSFENETAKFAEIGGMKRLRNWIELRKTYFLEEAPDELDPPRGILLLGVQGCGKSLAAKAAAGIFGCPLLRLDFGVLYNKYFGETERNLRKALETAEVMAPCVLWMDEIEKAIAVQEDDEGVSRRVLGTLLTWMSEKRRPVFLVATANDIGRLPPEIVRKGRFDEIFFVDLPSAENRRAIFGIHLSKRHLDPARFDLDALITATDGFSGSEIEQAIVSAMYAAHELGTDVSEKELLAEIQQTKPLSVVMAERVEEVRDWCAKRTVPCD